MGRFVFSHLKVLPVMSSDRTDAVQLPSPQATVDVPRPPAPTAEAVRPPVVEVPGGSRRPSITIEKPGDKIAKVKNNQSFFIYHCI